MKKIDLRRELQHWCWLVAIGVGGVALGCGQDPSTLLDDQVSMTSSALTSTPADPVAFCKSSGLNVILGTPNNDVINGTANADCIVGFGGQDTINGNGGNDIIFGGDGDDIINGGPGDDQIYGGAGQDNIHGNAGNDLILGEDGDDVLAGDANDDTIFGGQGQDRITGGAGNDTITGDAGDDRLDGGAGDDTLSDCTGHNTFIGGAGTNSCQGSRTGDNSSTFTQCQTIPACPGPVVNEWPQFQHDAIHSGVNLAETAFTPANVSSPLTIKFKAHFGSNVVGDGGAVVSGGFLYVPDVGGDPDFAGKVSVFDAAGCGSPVGGSCEPIWQGLTAGGITTTPAVANGFVMVASRAADAASSPFLFGFAAGGCGAATCQPVWRGVLQDGVVDSSPAVVNGIAYIGDFSGRFYAFDVVACGAAHNLNCQPLWTGQAGPEEELLTAPVVGSHFVIISSFLNDPNFFGGKVNAFRVGGCGNLPNVPCAPVWTADLGSPGSGQTLSGSTVFVGCATGVFAYNENGCGAAACKALRFYDTGDPELSAGVQGAPVVSGPTLLVSTENSPDPSAIGVVSAYSAAGTTNCSGGVCEPIWIGVNFANGFQTSPAVAGNVVFVGKAPASGFPVDAGVFTYDVRGCGAGQLFCLPLSVTLVGDSQFSLRASLAIAGHTVYYMSNDNNDLHSNVYALTVP